MPSATVSGLPAWPSSRLYPFSAAERIEVPSGQYRGNPLLAVAAARLGLDAASVAAAGLQEALDAVARVTSDLAAREDGTDE